MNLTLGQQLQNPGQSLYEVGELLSQTENCLQYSGLRRFLNYKFQERHFYYSARDEWSKVLIKIPATSGSQSESDLEFSRKTFEYECQSVLSQHVVWFPQLIDWLEIPMSNTEDAETSQKAPVIISDYPYTESLAERFYSDQLSGEERIQLVFQLLDFFDAIQNSGQYCHGVSPEEFKVGTDLRLQCTFSNRIFPIDQSASRPTSQTGIYYAPELNDPGSKITLSTDLYHWALLAALIIGGEKTLNEFNESQNSPVLSKPLLKEIRQIFIDSAESKTLIIRPLSPIHYQKKARQMITGLGDMIPVCLHPKSSKRPDSFKDLRQKASRSAAGGFKKILNPFS